MEKLNRTEVVRGIAEALDAYAIQDVREIYTDGEWLIPVSRVEKILDEFYPKWRRRDDPYYKRTKVVTEDQLDRNINQVYAKINNETEEMRKELVKLREKVDEYECQMIQVQKIIERYEKVAAALTGK